MAKVTIHPKYVVGARVWIIGTNDTFGEVGQVVHRNRSNDTQPPALGWEYLVQSSGGHSAWYAHNDLSRTDPALGRPVNRTAYVYSLEESVRRLELRLKQDDLSVSQQQVIETAINALYDAINLTSD